MGKGKNTAGIIAGLLSRCCSRCSSQEYFTLQKKVKKPEKKLKAKANDLKNQALDEIR